MTGSRPPLDDDGDLRLDEVLGERYARHYRRVLASASPDPWPFRDGPGREAGWPSRAARHYASDDGWVITLEGPAERQASSCQELATRSCWDVCGYYRRLGVHWKASVAEIRRAYLSLDPCGENEPLHYALTQLLDPATRRAYDLQPLGGLFLADRDVAAMIERAAARRAAAMRAEALACGLDDPAATQESVLRDMGFQREGPPSSPVPLRLHRSWGWGWYRMALPSGGGGPEVPPAALATWQAMVAAELSARGITDRFAVGTWPGPGVKAWRDGNESCIIFFISNGQPTQEMAREAVDQSRGRVIRETSSQERGT